jgi:hypothetical protein
VMLGTNIPGNSGYGTGVPWYSSNADTLIVLSNPA